MLKLSLFPNYKGVGPAAWGWETNPSPGSYLYNRGFYNQTCHRSLVDWRGGGAATAVFSNFNGDSKDNAVTNWLGFIHNPVSSPWRSLFTDGFTIIKHKNCLRIPVTETTNHQLLCNFVVANRMSIDRIFNINFWWEMKEKAGLTPHEAFAIMGMFYRSDEVIQPFVPTDHYPLSSRYQSSFERISKGNPNLLSWRTTRRMNEGKLLNGEYGKEVSDNGLLMNMIWCDSPAKFKRIKYYNSLMDADEKDFKYTGLFPEQYRLHTANKKAEKTVSDKVFFKKLQDKKILSELLAL